MPRPTSFRLEENTLKRIQQIATDLDCSQADALQVAVAQYLQHLHPAIAAFKRQLTAPPAKPEPTPRRTRKSKGG